jgi:hypothetical protein
VAVTWAIWRRRAIHQWGAGFHGQRHVQRVCERHARCDDRLRGFHNSETFVGATSTRADLRHRPGGQRNRPGHDGDTAPPVRRSRRAGRPMCPAKWCFPGRPGSSRPAMMSISERNSSPSTKASRTDDRGVWSASARPPLVRPRGGPDYGRCTTGASTR